MISLVFHGDTDTGHHYDQKSSYVVNVELIGNAPGGAKIDAHFTHLISPDAFISKTGFPKKGVNNPPILLQDVVKPAAEGGRNFLVVFLDP